VVSTGGDPSLRERIARGEYVVDPRAVAEAMLSAAGRARTEGLWRSTVLVAPESLDRPPVGAEENEPLPGDDVA
jgi:hypothetical protein